MEEQISRMILTKAYKTLNENPLPNIGATVGLVNEKDIYNWKCSLIGPNDSPYKNGFFRLFIKFPKDYPVKGPEVIFDTPIYHLNVNPVKGEQALGHCCINTINFWTPDTSIEDLLVSIFALFYAANPESPFGLHIKQEFEQDRNKYDTKAKYFTEKYAIPSFSSKNLDRWDFTYNN